MKAAGLAGLVASAGTAQANAGTAEYQGSTLTDLSDIRVTSIVPHPKVGPAHVEEDHYFAGPGWGVRFAVDDPAHIESAMLDAEETGSITATLHRFGNGESQGVVAEQRVELSRGPQRVTLDMVVPEAGEYLLTHHDDLALRVYDWKDWGRQGGVDLIGAHHADPDRSPVNDEWYYYFFDLEIATAEFQLQGRQVDGTSADSGGSSDSGDAAESIPKLYDMRAIVDEAGRSDGTPIDDLLRATYRSAETDDVILFRDGTYRIEEDHEIGTALTLRGQNAVLDMADGVRFGFRGSYHSYSGADTSVTTTPTGSIRKGARAINTNDNSEFSEGDYILVETTGRRPLSTGSRYKCQVMRIESLGVTTDWITCEQGTQTRFPSDTRIVRLDPVEGPVFENLRVRGGEIPLRMESCVNGRFENCHVEGYGRYAHRTDYCLGTVMNNPVALNPTSRSGGHGEAINVAHSTNTTVNNPRVHKCRRGVDAFNGVFGLEVNNPYVTGATMHAICDHGPSPSGNIVVNGGTLENDQLDGESDEYYWGNGFSMGSECESIKVHGTTIRATRSAISGSCQNLTANGLVIESIYKSVGSGSNTLSDEPIAIRFSGGKARISGVLNDEHGQYSRTTSTGGADSTSIDLL